MKIFTVIMAGLLLAASVVSCNKKDDQTSDNSSTQGQSSSVTAFFPIGYDQSKVVAWYTTTETQQDGQVNVLAIYIFEDNSVLAALYKKKSDGREQRTIDVTGTCRLVSGDYTNGTVVVSIPNFGEDMNLTIQNGVFTARGETFTKQDNAKIPSPQQVTEDNGQGGGNNSGTLSDKAEAYLPISYADKTIAAWYAYSNEENDRVKTEAAFLFTDKSLLVTKSKVYSEASGKAPQKEISVEGTYELTSGDYDNGTATATVDNSTFTVTINNGILTAVGNTYTKQDNANAPAPSK